MSCILIWLPRVTIIRWRHQGPPPGPDHLSSHHRMSEAHHTDWVHWNMIRLSEIPPLSKSHYLRSEQGHSFLSSCKILTSQSDFYWLSFFPCPMMVFCGPSSAAESGEAGTWGRAHRWHESRDRGQERGSWGRGERRVRRVTGHPSHLQSGCKWSHLDNIEADTQKVKVI